MNDYAELDLGGTTTLAFADEGFVAQNIGTNAFRPNRLGDKPAAGAGISLTVDAENGETVEGIVKRVVQAGAVVVQEPMVKPWGQVVAAYLKYCNGFLGGNLHTGESNLNLIEISRRDDSDWLQRDVEFR